MVPQTSKKPIVPPAGTNRTFATPVTPKQRRLLLINTPNIHQRVLHPLRLLLDYHRLMILPDVEGVLIKLLLMLLVQVIPMILMILVVLILVIHFYQVFFIKLIVILEVVTYIVTCF